MRSLPPPITTVFLLFTIFDLRHLTAFGPVICHPGDEATLLAFKASISDPSGLLNTWKAGTGCCNTWSGVRCQDTEPNRVVALNLTGEPGNPNSSISGTLPSSLSKLQYLDSIYILNNPMLTGPFPIFLFDLPRLLYVYLEYNGLSGTIPEDIGKMTTLVAFSLDGNNFSGSIPSSVGRLTNLLHLRLGSNRLIGTIPDGIKHLKNLIWLNLGGNQLTGAIPDILSELTAMRKLILSHNNFTGKIPVSMSAFGESLEALDLGHNALTGHIPDIFGNFTYLGSLDLSWNQFSGVVPKSFAGLKNMERLDLSHNSLVDPFPNMTADYIETFDLSYNQFQLGNVPTCVTSSPGLKTLKLVKCGLKFNLDDWSPHSGFFQYIDLSENEITGSPVKLLNNTENIFVTFDATGNKLKFNFESLVFPEKLKELHLSRNLVYGKVPKAVSGLLKLNVSQNHLCGELPKTQFPASAFAGNDCLCGSPLSPCKS